MSSCRIRVVVDNREGAAYSRCRSTRGSINQARREWEDHGATAATMGVAVQAAPPLRTASHRTSLPASVSPAPAPFALVYIPVCKTDNVAPARTRRQFAPRSAEALGPSRERSNHRSGQAHPPPALQKWHTCPEPKNGIPQRHSTPRGKPPPAELSVPDLSVSSSCATTKPEQPRLVPPSLIGRNPETTAQNRAIMRLGCVLGGHASPNHFVGVRVSEYLTRKGGHARTALRSGVHSAVALRR